MLNSSFTLVVAVFVALAFCKHICSDFVIRTKKHILITCSWSRPERFSISWISCSCCAFYHLGRAINNNCVASTKVVAWELSLPRVVRVGKHSKQLALIYHRKKVACRMQCRGRKPTRHRSTASVTQYTATAVSSLFDSEEEKFAVSTILAQIQCNTHAQCQALPFIICTFRRRNTMSRVTILPQQRCCSHGRPRLLSLMPTISRRTPLGWRVDDRHVTYENDPFRWAVESCVLGFCTTIAVSKSVYKCTWVFSEGTRLRGV